MRKLIPAVGYLRMSTDKQETSPEQQRSEILRYATAHGFTILQWYEDLGISGDRTEKRVGFQTMIADASDGRFQAILCWDQDRFGRFDSLESGYWIHPLRKRGVQLVTVTDGPVDWNSFAGRMIYGMKQEGKHQYLIDLSNNVSRRCKQLAQQGQWFAGRPPFAYVLGEDRKLKLGPPELVAAIKFVFDQYEAGQSTRQISLALKQRGIVSLKGKQFTATAISELIKNPAYSGTFRYGLRNHGKYQRSAGDPRRRAGDEVVEILNCHPAIVSVEQQRKCIQQLTERKRVTAPTKGGAFALTGLLKCSHCGNAMHGDNANRTHSYTCYTYHQRPGVCERHSIREEEVLRRILVELKERLFESGIVKRLRTELVSQLAQPTGAASRIADKVEALNTKIAAAEFRLMEVSRDMIPRVEAQIRELIKQRDELNDSLRNAPAPITPADIDKRIKEALAWFKQLEKLSAAQFNPQHMRHMLAEFIDKVDLRFERVQWGRSGTRFKCNLVGGVIHFKLWGVVHNGGPLLDRIDIHIEVPAVPFQELSAGAAGTSSQQMREDVLAARKRQCERFRQTSNLTNAQMSSRQLREFCVLDNLCRIALRDSVQEMGLSARAHDKILRVARTIADLECADEIELAHLHEAINYRMLDRTLMQ